MKAYSRLSDTNHMSDLLDAHERTEPEVERKVDPN